MSFPQSDSSSFSVLFGAVWRNGSNEHRLVCSSRSAPPSPSPSTSGQNSTKIPLSGQKHTSERFSSASTDPSFPTKALSLPRCRMDPPQRSSQPRTIYTRAFWCHSWLCSSQCCHSVQKLRGRSRTNHLYHTPVRGYTASLISKITAKRGSSVCKLKVVQYTASLSYMLKLVCTF